MGRDQDAGYGKPPRHGHQCGPQKRCGFAGQGVNPEKACTSPATCWPMPAARAGASSPPSSPPPSPRRTPTARRPSGVRSPTSSGPRCPSWQFSWTKPSTTSSPARAAGLPGVDPARGRAAAAHRSRAFRATPDPAPGAAPPSARRSVRRFREPCPQAVAISEERRLAAGVEADCDQAIEPPSHQRSRGRPPGHGSGPRDTLTGPKPTSPWRPACY